MSTFRISALSVLTILLFAQCEAPPPGSVVFDGEGNADEVVRDYLNIDKESFEGHSMIDIPTQSLRNRRDTNDVYVPDVGRPANFR